MFTKELLPLPEGVPGSQARWEPLSIGPGCRLPSMMKMGEKLDIALSGSAAIGSDRGSQTGPPKATVSSGPFLSRFSGASQPQIILCSEWMPQQETVVIDFPFPVHCDVEWQLVHTHQHVNDTLPNLRWLTYVLRHQRPGAD